MEHKRCGVCQARAPCLILCACKQPLCRACSDQIVSQAAIPHCPACDLSLPLQQSLASASPVQKTSRQSLSKTRVVQRNLIYIIGLSSKLASSPRLETQVYFGQYGKIKKLVINRLNPFMSPVGPSFSVYITYSTEMEATLCARACDGFKYDGMTLRTTFGTSKYCNSFLVGRRCAKPECTYLHEMGSRIDSFTREEIQKNAHMQPHNSIYPMLKVVVEPPGGLQKLPKARVARRVYSPKKENREAGRVSSRFGFELDCGEEAAEVPRFLGDLVASSSPAQMETKVRAETAKEIMKDGWARDVLVVKSLNEDFLVSGNLQVEIVYEIDWLRYNGCLHSK